MPIESQDVVLSAAHFPCGDSGSGENFRRLRALGIARLLVARRQSGQGAGDLTLINYGTYGTYENRIG